MVCTDTSCPTPAVQGMSRAQLRSQTPGPRSLHKSWLLPRKQHPASQCTRVQGRMLPMASTPIGHCNTVQLFVAASSSHRSSFRVALQIARGKHAGPVPGKGSMQPLRLAFKVCSEERTAVAAEHSTISGLGRSSRYWCATAKMCGCTCLQATSQRRRGEVLRAMKAPNGIAATCVQFEHVDSRTADCSDIGLCSLASGPFRTLTAGSAGKGRVQDM